MRVVFERPHKCLNKLPLGAIKRVPAGGALIGYYYRCLSCGARSVHLHDEAKFTESSAWVDDMTDGVRFQRPESISAENPLACHGCSKKWLLHDGHLIENL